jgi:hypothetical protein
VCQENLPRKPAKQTRKENTTSKRNNRLPIAGGSHTMSKPTKTEAELIAMAQTELKAHLECPVGMTISILRWGGSWEFRAKADAGTASKPGYPECVAMLVQIGDHLRKQYDVTG